MDEDKARFLRKLRQIEEHARALTHELSQGPLQNQARLILGLASHLVVRYELDRAKTITAVRDDKGPWKTDNTNF